MEYGSVIYDACRGQQWMRLVWLACATMPACGPLVRIRGVVTFRSSSSRP